MPKTIYPGRHSVVEKLLDKHPLRKILIAPVDFAKNDHVAQLCLGNGDFILKRPLTVYNTEKGAAYLLKRIESACKKYHIPMTNVIIGGEDPPEYCWNFTAYFQLKSIMFVRVNACEAVKYRTNRRAVSDHLVLNGIAQAMINRRAYEIKQCDELYSVLKSAFRSRRRLVRDETRVKNRIHRLVDVLFPGFLSEKQSGVSPFTSGCLNLLSIPYFSSIKIRRMSQKSLTSRLHTNRITNPEQTANKLKQLAENSLPPQPELISWLSKNLKAKVDLLKSVQESIRCDENEMARCLVQTPGFYLTSIPGIGVVLASGIIAESGSPDHWPHPDKLASYAGIVCREFQSGGSDNKPIKGKLPLNANHHLKDYLIQAAQHVGQTLHPAGKVMPEFKEHRLFKHFQQVHSRGGKSMISTAKLLLKIASTMLPGRSIYLPENFIKPDAGDPVSADTIILYHEAVEESLQQKWKRFDLSGIPDEKNEMLKLQQTVKDLKKLKNNFNL